MGKNNIAYLRMKYDKTQQELAEMTGLSRTYISELENGKYPLSQKSRLKIAQALGIDESEIEEY